MALAIKKEIVEITIAFFVLLGMAWGATEYFAKHEDLVFVKASQQLHFTSHAINETQNRIWQLEDRHGTSNCNQWNDQKDKNEYRRLQEKLEKLKKKEDQLIKNTTNEGG